MAITWKTWDRALEGVINGIIASGEPPTATAKAMSGAIHSLVCSQWEAADFVANGGIYSDTRAVVSEIVWQRPPADAPAAAPTEGG